MSHKKVQRGWRDAFASTAMMAILLTASQMGSAAAQELHAPGATDLSRFSTEAGSTAALPENPMDSQAAGAPPRPLDLVNADRYRDIFRLQDAGDFAGADRIISQLTDLSLLGQVLADRYLSPQYRSTTKELSEWLADYAALPDAALIYRLAKRKGASADLPEPKTPMPTHGTGEDNQADRNGVWDAGLAAWKRGDFAAAAVSFSRLAETKEASPSNKARYSYWAARAYLRDKKPEKVSYWLKVAAKQPLTFYGQLARRALGVEEEIQWTVSTFNAQHGEQLMKSSAGKRALSLIQVGRVEAAEKELLQLERESIGRMEMALLALSQKVNLPELAARLRAFEPAEEGDIGDDALFPIPSYKPRYGFTLDRALIYAIMRLESGFNPKAVSPAGAIGLMQMMPRTASLMGYKPERLRDPGIALEAGEVYINHLLEEPVVRGDILLMLAAYNAGPGNLLKWKQAAKNVDDALLFLESMPSAETRRFVRRAMASYWIYQQRLGQDTPGLTALASGGWPLYESQDEKVAAAN